MSHETPSLRGHGTGTPWYRELSRKDWKAFFAAWLGYLMDGFDFVLITLVLTEVADEFDLSMVTATTLVAAAFISRWFGGLALGALGDRFGRKPAMITSIVLYSVGSLLCGLAPGYWVMFAARLLVGLGMAGEYSASATYVIESWPRHLRNRASAFLISGFAFGSIIAGQTYRFVVPAWGWRSLFLLGLIPIVLALWMRRGLPESKDWEEAKSLDDRAAPAERNFVEILYRSRLAWLNIVATLVISGALFLIFTERAEGYIWPLALLVIAGFVLFAVQFAGRRAVMMVTLMITVFCAFLYSWPLQALLPTYLKTDLGFDPDTLANILFWAGFGNAAGTILAGFTGDRLGTRKAYCLTLGASMFFVIPVFAMHADQTLFLGVLLFCQQATAQGISGLLPKLVGGYFDTGERAAGLGFTYNVGALGGAVAPVLGAALSDGKSLGPSLAWITFALTGVVILLVAIDAPSLAQRTFHRLRGESGAAAEVGLDLTEDSSAAVAASGPAESR